MRNPLKRAAHLGVVVAAVATTLLGTSAAQADVNANGVQGFQNQSTGTCLTDPFSDGRCAAPNGISQWNVTGKGGGYVELRNVASGLCLDYFDGPGLRTMPCNGTTPQDWYVWHNPDGSLTFEATEGQGAICLDSSDASGPRGFPCNKTAYQRWQ